MTLLDFMMNIVMMDTEDITVKDNKLNELVSGDFDKICDYAMENDDLKIEGAGTYDGRFTIILD